MPGNGGQAPLYGIYATRKQLDTSHGIWGMGLTESSGPSTQRYAQSNITRTRQPGCLKRKAHAAAAVRTDTTDTSEASPRSSLALRNRRNPHQYASNTVRYLMSASSRLGRPSMQPVSSHTCARVTPAHVSHGR